MKGISNFMNVSTDTPSHLAASSRLRYLRGGKGASWGIFRPYMPLWAESVARDGNSPQRIVLGIIGPFGVIRE